MESSISFALGRQVRPIFYYNHLHYGGLRCMKQELLYLLLLPNKRYYAPHRCVLKSASPCKLQSMMSVILKTVILPYANLHLWKGLPLPLLHGFILQNADILSTDSRVVICSDVAYAERWYSVVRGLVLS